MKNSKPLIIALVLIAAFYIFINFFNYDTFNSSEIFYSDFLNILEKGEVASVKIKGDRIDGAFLNNQKFYVYSHFNEELIDKLREQSVFIEIKEFETTPWYISLLIHWGPLLFLIGIWVYMLRKGPGNTKGIFSIGRSKAKKITQEQSPVVTFDDVVGIDGIREEVTEIVDFLRDHRKFSKLGGRIPRGILMVGAPGTGKTLLAKAIAGESKVPFFSIAGSEFVEMFVGVGASRVRDLFQQAKADSPCIVFIDEIDAVGRHRGAGLGSGHDEREQTLNQLLIEMDGFHTNQGIIVIAATNRADILDGALLRPGRFDRQVHLPLPDINGRMQILKVHTKKMRISAVADLEAIAKSTPGFSGAQLANLVNEAALHSAKNDKTEVDQEALEYSRDKVMMGIERKSLVMTPEVKKNTAYHEAGHALVTAFLENTDPVHKITIIPRGAALGATSFLPEKDYFTHSREQLESKIIVSMGGRAAEEIVFNERTSGAESDLKYATKIAYNMVCRWGMSLKLGALTVQDYNKGSFLAMNYHQSQTISEELKSKIDQEIKNLLQECYSKAKDILLEHRTQLDKLANLLLDKESVSSEEFQGIVLNA